MPHAGRHLALAAGAVLTLSGVPGLASSAAGVRVIRVKAVADEAFRDKAGWEAEIRQDLEWADETLRDLAGIGVQLVAVAPWTTHRGTAMPLLLQELRTGVEKDGAEVVMGFTGHPPPAAMTFLPGNPKRFPVPFTTGIALPLGDRAVVRRTEWSELMRHTLIHEIAHLFGGLHVREDSLLESATDHLSLRLDPFNRRVLDMTRERDFDRGIRELTPKEMGVLVALYRQAPLLADGDPDTVVRIAYVLLLAGEVEDALQELQRVVEVAPEQAREVIRHVMIPELEAWAQVRESTVHTRYLLARAFALAERWPDARALLEPACRTPPRDAPSCALLGAAELESGRLDRAEVSLRAALRRDDTLVEAYRTLARVYVAEGRYDEALESFGRALELDPEDVETHFDAGQAYLAADKPGAAEASFREVLRLHDAHDEARSRLAVALARQGKDEEAQALLVPFERLRSLPAVVLRDMAEVYVLTGDAARAFETLQQAKRGGIDVEDVEALIRKGVGTPREVAFDDLVEQAEAYWRTRRYGTARALLERARKKEPREPRVHYWLGRVAAAEGDREGASGHLQRSVALDPGFGPARYELARRAYEEEDFGQVVSWLEPYVEAGEAGSGAHFMLGRSQFELGRVAEAEEHLRAAVRKRVDYGDAFYFLGRLYLEEARDAEARQELELAVGSRSLPAWRREDAHLRLARLLEAAGRGQEARAHAALALASGGGAGSVAQAASPTDRIEIVRIAPTLTRPLPRGQEILISCTVHYELATAPRGTVFLAPQDESGLTLLRPQPRAAVERGQGEVTLQAPLTIPTQGDAVELFLALHAEGHRTSTAVTRARYALE